MVFVYFESNPSAKSHYKPRFHGEMLLNRLKPISKGFVKVRDLKEKEEKGDLKGFPFSSCLKLLFPLLFPSFSLLGVLILDKSL